MEGAINRSEIQLEACVTQDRTQTIAETTSEEHSTWTVRKIIILATIFLVYFVTYAAYTVYAPFLPSVASDKGVSSTVVGLIFGTYSFVIFLFSPVCSFLIPKYGASYVLLTGILLCGGSLIIFAFGGMLSDKITFIVFCFLIRTTSAIGGAAAETSSLSIIIETFPNNVGAVTGAVETFVGIGLTLGPALGGFLYTVGGFKLPFIVLSCVLIATIPPVLFLLYKKENKNREETAERSTSFFEALRIPAVFMLGLCYVIDGIAFGYIDPIFGPEMKKLGQNATQIGLLFLLYSAVFSFTAPGIGWIIDKKNWHRGILILGFTGFGVGFLLLGPATFLTFLPQRKLWLVYIAMPFCGLSQAFCFVPTMPALIRTARVNGMPDNSSTNAVLSSIFGSTFFLGATIGPGIAGISVEYLGFHWATSIVAFICFGQAVLLSAFTLFEHMSQRNNNNRCDDEKQPLMLTEKPQQSHQLSNAQFTELSDVIQ